MTGPGMMPRDAGMFICLGCGAIAPTRRNRECAMCAMDLPAMAARAFVPRTAQGDMFWVAVRCRFQCRVCGHASPLDHLDMDGSVVCMACGMSQAFDVSAWNEALAHAHAVGDLSGPEPEGRFPDALVSIADANPFAEIGVKKTYAELAMSGMSMEGGMVIARSLMIQAAPGHPLCIRCRTPLEVSSLERGQLSVRCPQCADITQYRTPVQALSACAGLVAVMADEHRADSREARVDRSEGGAIAIRCPNCSGAVAVTGASTVIDCQYCHVSLRVPNTAFHGLGSSVPEPATWWLLFQGASSRRVELSSGSLAGDDSDESEVSLISLERAPSGAYGWGTRIAAIAIPLAIFLSVGYVFFFEHMERWAK